MNKLDYQLTQYTLAITDALVRINLCKSHAVHDLGISSINARIELDNARIVLAQLVESRDNLIKEVRIA